MGVKINFSMSFDLLGFWAYNTCPLRPVTADAAPGIPLYRANRLRKQHMLPAYYPRCASASISIRISLYNPLTPTNVKSGPCFGQYSFKFRTTWPAISSKLIPSLSTTYMRVL